MNTLPSYNEMFNKITEAYISGKLEPCNSCACFIGNMLNGKYGWADKRILSNPIIALKPDEYETVFGFYTMSEIVSMEENFLHTINLSDGQKSNKYEDTLFMAMETTLDMLKSIHESKGEIIDEAPVFTKRQLQTTPTI